MLIVYIYRRTLSRLSGILMVYHYEDCIPGISTIIFMKPCMPDNIMETISQAKGRLNDVMPISYALLIIIL